MTARGKTIITGRQVLVPIGVLMQTYLYDGNLEADDRYFTARVLLRSSRPRTAFGADA